MIIITVKTSSGSTYRIAQNAGRTTYVVKVGEWAGEVIAFQKEPIRRGKSINMMVRRKGTFGKNANIVEPVSTTLVKDVYVSL